MSAVRCRQAELSPIATGPLLVALGSPEIKQTLRACCGSWADRPATELLAALRDYVSSVEVVHNFDALPPKHASGGRPGRLGASGATCVDLKLAAAAPYLPNLWDVEFLNATSGICSNPSENNAERAIMGFRPFTSSKEIVDFGKNVSMPFPGRYAEAAERPVCKDRPTCHASPRPHVPPTCSRMVQISWQLYPRQGQRREVKLFLYEVDVWPGEEGGWGQLGQFQRHMVGGGVNHLGGRRGGVGCGFGGPGDPCGERNTAFDSTLLSSGGVLEGK